MGFRSTLLVFLALFSFISLVSPLPAAEGKDNITPERRQLKVTSGEQSPSWMDIWQLAREAKKSGDQITAKKKYLQLFQKKSNIEEARREYAHLLLELREFEEAFAVLQGLIELNPDSLEYLLHAGEAALQLKRYNRAASYLGQVYTMEPNGRHAIDALQGQILALQKQGQKELAYPLMEQLYLLVPHEEKAIRLLAQYSAELSQKDKAVNYYQILINEFTPTAEDLLAGEKLFTEAGLEDMAIACWKKYLQIHSYYIPFHKKLAAYYMAGEEKEKALDHLLVLVAHGTDDPSVYHQIGQLYIYSFGRPDKALYYYDEYRKRVPRHETIENEIARIQSVLADDLLVIVENSGAWNLWRDLAKVIPDRLAVYYSIADKLQQLNKPKELREVLEIINFHNPDDQDILFQLASLLYQAQDYEGCRTALNSLDNDHKKSAEYFMLQAKVLEREGNYSDALTAYISFFNNGGDDSKLLLHSLELAGMTGMIKVLDELYLRSQNEKQHIEIKTEAAQLYGEILVDNSLYTKARKFFEQSSHTSLSAVSSHNSIATQRIRILREEGKFFEAEQNLRALLIRKPHKQEYLRLLVENSLQARDWHNAWRWHHYREEEKNQERENPELSEELFLEKLSILSGSNQLDTAIDDAEIYLLENPNSEAVRLTLAELYYLDEQYLAAYKLLRSHSIDDDRSKLLQELLQHKNKIVQPAATIPQQYQHSLNWARTYLKYGVHEQALNALDKYLERYGTSVEGRVLKAKILRSMGDDFHAMQIYKDLSGQYPEEEFFRMQIIQLNFDRSKFANVIQALDPEKQTTSERNHSLTRQNVLLLARSYWAQKNTKKALSIYAEFLQPPVDILFSKKLEEHTITLQLPAPKRTFLNKITFTNPSQPDRLRVVMRPRFIREHQENPVLDIITSLYADYRWQQLVQQELKVRQEMADGNYYQAMNDYQKMLKHNPSMESLYDLAGIYSRLGFLGKEAALYGVMQQESPGYPYLDEAMERNRLKREPRVSPLYDFEQKEGRKGYFNNKQHSFGLNAWYMPSLNHVLSMDYRRIYNQSLDGETDIWRNRFNVKVDWSPGYDLDLFTKFGMDGGESAGQSTLLYDFTLRGKVGDQVQGFARVSQDIVDDTVEALIDTISVTEYEAGLHFDIFPRWFAGGNYQFSDYSDSNYQNRYGIWSSYTLLPEPLLLQIRYDYELSHNQKRNKSKQFALTGEYVPNDHYYWSPKEYWQHAVGISFEHQLTDDVLGRGAPSYYSLGYSFGYEDGGNVNHFFNAKIFLEISRHFLLNTTFHYIHGDEFETTQADIYLIYRW